MTIGGCCESPAALIGSFDGSCFPQTLHFAASFAIKTFTLKDLLEFVLQN